MMVRTARAALQAGNPDEAGRLMEQSLASAPKRKRYQGIPAQALPCLHALFGEITRPRHSTHV